MFLNENALKANDERKRQLEGFTCVSNADRRDSDSQSRRGVKPSGLSSFRIVPSAIIDLQILTQNERRRCACVCVA